MKFKHYDLEIPQGEPFANCKLNRQLYAMALTNIIANYEDNFVLALNSRWGTGKTTFVKMWNAHLQDKEYKTLYLNAWENDLLTDPTVAILGELRKLTSIPDKGKFKKVLDCVTVIAKNIVPALGNAAAKRYIDSDTISEAVENTLKAATEIINKEVEQYSKKTQTIEKFKISLSEFIKQESPDKPVVFIVDELDRCRPNYAVEILEKIKHFFSVPGVIFTIVIDKEQLCSSIKGFYGSESIDSNEYLRRFIDIEFGLPEPNIEEYCQYLYEYYNFTEFFQSGNRAYAHKIENEAGVFKCFSVSFCQKHRLSLRQIEKIFAHARLGLLSFDDRTLLLPSLYFLLIALRDQQFTLYEKLRLKKLSVQELSDQIIPILRLEGRSDDSYLYSQLLLCYGIFISQYERTTLIVGEPKQLTFQTTVDNSRVIQCIEHNSANYHDSNILSPIIANIELFSNVQ